MAIQIALQGKFAKVVPVFRAVGAIKTVPLDRFVKITNALLSPNAEAIAIAPQVRSVRTSLALQAAETIASAPMALCVPTTAAKYRTNVVMHPILNSFQAVVAHLTPRRRLIRQIMLGHAVGQVQSGSLS